MAIDNKQTITQPIADFANAVQIIKTAILQSQELSGRRNGRMDAGQQLNGKPYALSVCAIVHDNEYSRFQKQDIRICER